VRLCRADSCVDGIPSTTCSRSARDRVEVLVEEDVGWPDISARLRDLESGTVVYCCGPAGMIAAAEASSWRIRHLVAPHRAFFIPFGCRRRCLHSVRRSPFALTARTWCSRFHRTEACCRSSATWCRAIHRRAGRARAEYARRRCCPGGSTTGDRVLSLEECERGDVMMVCVSRADGDLPHSRRPNCYERPIKPN